MERDISFISFLSVIGVVVAVLLVIVTAMTYITDTPTPTVVCKHANGEHGVCTTSQPQKAHL